MYLYFSWYAQINEPKLALQTVASVGSNEFANVILTDHGIKSADRPTQLVVTGPVSWGLVALLFTGNPGPPNPIFCAAVRIHFFTCYITYLN